MLLSVPVPAHLFPQPGEQFSFLSVEDGTQIISVTWQVKPGRKSKASQHPVTLGGTKLTVIETTTSPLSHTHTCTHTNTYTLPRKLWSGLERVEGGFLCLTKIYTYSSNLVFSLLFGIWGQSAHREKGNCIDQQRTVNGLFSQVITSPHSPL